MADEKPTTAAAAKTAAPAQSPAPTNKPAPNQPFNFNELVKQADVIEGFDILDKAELVGVEFVITGITFRTGSRNVGYVYVDGVKRSGEKFTFNDSSSTGIKAQLIEMATRKNLPVDYESGELLPVMIHVPRGVRVSEYEIKDVNNKDRKARTYYLTTGGQ